MKSVKNEVYDREFNQVWEQAHWQVWEQAHWQVLDQVYRQARYEFTAKEDLKRFEKN